MSNEFILSPDEKRKEDKNLTGWTPLVNKTFFNEQLLSFNSTPNKNYEDYSTGFNLTPFLAHNTNLHPGSAGFNSVQQLSNITPFHEKTVHLADFFMDSPIRQEDTITPSKFEDRKRNKRSITSVDTPPRQPHKLSISTTLDDKKAFLQTPSRKILGDVTNKAFRTPQGASKAEKHFVTPKQDSSPSTVIMSSATRSDCDTEEEKKVPGSPTPAKQILTEENKPTMGVFQERKRPKRKMQSGMNKFQIVFTDVHALVNKKKKRKTAPSTSSSKSAPSNTSMASISNSTINSMNSMGNSSLMNATANTSMHSMMNNTMRPMGHPMMTPMHNMSHTSNMEQSFELGGLLSTPNSKYLFDKDKVSPNNSFHLPYMSKSQQDKMMVMVMSTPQRKRED